MNQSPDKDRTVLVVENNPDDILLLELAAKEMCPGISMVTVTDGPAALAYLGGQRPCPAEPTQGAPDLVLLDARLFKMDDHTVVSQIRQMPGLSQLKVLLWTDGVEPDWEEQARQAGADLFMRKPLSFHELLGRVKQICDLAGATS